MNRIAALVTLALALTAPSTSLAKIISASPPAAPVACDARECRQFDFWVGDWNVLDPAGKLAGTSHVENILNGCVIFENWTGARGMSGKSFNRYSPADQKWHQTWVDDRGGSLDLAGSFENGVMTLEGEKSGKDGGTVRNRITWERLSDGRVRQHWTQSTDGGATWSEAFTGLYAKRGKSK